MRKTNKLLDICETIEKMCDKDNFVSDFLENISSITSLFIFSMIKEWRELQKENVLSEEDMHEQFYHFKKGLESEIKINYILTIDYITKLENLLIKKDREFISNYVKEIKENFPQRADEIDEDFSEYIKDIGGFNG